MRNLIKVGLVISLFCFSFGCGSPSEDETTEASDDEGTSEAVDDPICEASGDYDYQDKCENDEPGGCDDDPMPTYSNSTCQSNTFTSGDFVSITFFWCCLENEYITENWELEDDGCWSLSSEFTSDGVCN